MPELSPPPNAAETSAMIASARNAIGVPIELAPPENSEPIAIGEIYVHRTSHSYYEVIALSRQMVAYQRFGDRHQVRLPVAQFHERLRAATNEEIARLHMALPALSVSRLAATQSAIDNALGGVGAALPSSVANGAPPDSEEVHAPNPPRRRRDEPEVGILVEPTERDNFNRLVLRKDIKADIFSGIRAIQRRDELDRVFRLSEIEPLRGRCILSFYGPPGTGKTQAARCIAGLLGKKLYQVDYAAIVSKYFGDTAKNIRQAFARARALDAILFFDEADSMMSRRVNMSHDGATTINQNRNVLMQELDRFDGIVICSTNLFKHFDAALLRRISAHIKFTLPDADDREAIFRLHLPAVDRLKNVDFKEIVDKSEGLAGGDIKNVCFNAMLKASEPDDSDLWVVTQEILMAQIDKVLTSKREHSSKKPLAATSLLQKILESHPGKPQTQAQTSVEAPKLDSVIDDAGAAQAAEAAAYEAPIPGESV